MTARTLARDVGLALSKRQAARLLRVDRGETLHELVRRGLLREVPWGRQKRIPLADVERLAATGFAVEGKRPRRASTAKRAFDPDAIRELDVESLRRPQP